MEKNPSNGWSHSQAERRRFYEPLDETAQYLKNYYFEIHTVSELALEVIDPVAINPTADAEVEELLYKSEAVWACAEAAAIKLGESDELLLPGETEAAG